MRGIAQGAPSLQLAEELGLDYGALLERRHGIQALALENRDSSPLPDQVTEADEMFQNAGEKGERHSCPNDPPRRRANKRRGAGTMENDRPPVAGTVGRESGRVRLVVCEDTKQATIQPPLLNAVPSGSVINTDESSAYEGVGDTGRTHVTVCHSAGERARDDDGDGIREVHDNTMEGMWTGLRNFLRPFRGVHKKYLKLYIVMFEWEYNLKRVTADFLRVLMIPGFTYLPI
jgi:transposase-like protein